MPRHRTLRKWIWEMSDRGNCPDCIEQIEAQAAEIEKLRGAVDALLQHEASTFFGPDGDKHMRASWRGVIRKARAALGEQQ
jgi:hypothetical protein